MAKEFKYICQVYQKSPKGHLVIDQSIECRSELAAEMRAEKIWQTGNYAGVDAVLIGADPEQGDYDEPVFITRLGSVPESE
jgi:hypothetical protein